MAIKIFFCMRGAFAELRLGLYFGDALC